MTGSFGFAPDDPRTCGPRARRRLTARVPRRATVRHVARPRGRRARAVPRDEERSGAARAAVHEGRGWRSSSCADGGAVKAVLLDQRVVAGLGNIYADEALWRARVSPLRPANDVTEDEVARLTRAIRAVLAYRDRAAGIDAARLRGAGRRVRLRCRRSSASTDATESRASAAARPSRRRVSAGAAPGTARAARPGRGPTPTLARGAHVQDRGGRAALVPLRRGRPRPPPVHAGARAGRRDREGSPQDEVALRRAARAVLARRAHAAPRARASCTRSRASRSSTRTAPAREDPYRLSVGLVGAEAMLRLFVEQEAQRARLRGADAVPRRCRRDPGRIARARRARSGRARVPAQAPLAVRLRAAPRELRRVRRGRGLSATSARAGGRSARPARPTRRSSSRPEGFRGMLALIWSPLSDALGLGLGERALRDALAVVVASYEYHGGFRLRTLAV